MNQHQINPLNKPAVVLIDPGHGGVHTGAVANGLREKDVNLQVGLLLSRILHEEGLSGIMTRRLDRHFNEKVGIDLAMRCQVEHRRRPDLFVSLHCNSFRSPGANGLEVFTTPGETAADPAATCIFRALRHAFPNSRFRTDFDDGDPDKEENFYVLRHTVAPAVLVEMGFLSNPREAEWLKDQSTQTQIAMAISSGILDWVANREEGG